MLCGVLKVTRLNSDPTVQGSSQGHFFLFFYFIFFIFKVSLYIHDEHIGGMVINLHDMSASETSEEEM